MLLTIDVGNTNMVLALFEGDVVKHQCRVSTFSANTSDEYRFLFQNWLGASAVDPSDVSGVIISSVVPQGLVMLVKGCREYFSYTPLVVGEDDVITGIGVDTENPHDVGADRLVNAVAASERFGTNLIVIDFGTATTFDVINEKGNYAGGAIAPGVNLSVEALHKAAAKLPEIEIARPEKVIATNTISAMQSGIYYGYVSMIEGMITRIKHEYGKEMKVIATGGLAKLMTRSISAVEEELPSLTLEGLNIIYKRNQ